VQPAAPAARVAQPVVPAPSEQQPGALALPEQRPVPPAQSVAPVQSAAPASAPPPAPTVQTTPPAAPSRQLAPSGQPAPHAAPDGEISRRDFLKLAATGLAGITTFGLLSALYRHVEAATLPPAAAEPASSIDDSSPSITRDMSKCIGCGNCVSACENVQRIGVYQLYQKDGRQYSNTKGEIPLAQTRCINCGQCVKVCPVGALAEKDSIAEALAAIDDPAKTVVWQIAPSVHNMLGEEFGLRSGADVTRKIATAMKMLGGYAFHTDFAADVTIMEEGTEFIRRLRGGGAFPMITSCCPGWIKYVEMHYPDLLPHVSSCKSPQQMLGALVKSYFAQKSGIPASGIFHISVMPCTAKKFECARPEMEDSRGARDVDLVLTAREFAKILRSKNIAFGSLPNGEFDSLMGEASGAARIFGASGGVMEASLRAVSLLLTNSDLPPGAVGTLRTKDGFKSASVTIAGNVFNFAAINGIGNIRDTMDQLRAGSCPYHFIEVMSCPGGCIGGGGAPLHTEDMDRRQQGLYRSDVLLKNTVCLENSEMRSMYAEFLGQPCGPLSEELLHTRYESRAGTFS
jgi:iron-only hydrogenase group A